MKAIGRNYVFHGSELRLVKKCMIKRPMVLSRCTEKLSPDKTKEGWDILRNILKLGKHFKGKKIISTKTGKNYSHKRYIYIWAKV